MAKLHKVLIIAALVAGLCLSTAQGAMEAGEEEAQGVAVSGKIMFTDYYSMAGQKCSAFLEGDDGGLYCILKNDDADELKEKLAGKSGRVKITGDLTERPKGKYIAIDKYEMEGKE